MRCLRSRRRLRHSRGETQGCRPGQKVAERALRKPKRTRREGCMAGIAVERQDGLLGWWVIGTRVAGTVGVWWRACIKQKGRTEREVERTFSPWGLITPGDSPRIVCGVAVINGKKCLRAGRLTRCAVVKVVTWRRPCRRLLSKRRHRQRRGEDTEEETGEWMRHPPAISWQWWWRLVVRSSKTRHSHVRRGVTARQADMF